MKLLSQQLPESFSAVFANYTQKFYESTITDSKENYIASPLGSWLLLATLAGSTDFSDHPAHKNKIETLLGFTLPESLAIAKLILQAEGMETAVGAWFRSSYVDRVPQLKKWLDTDTVAEKDSEIPSQDWLDAWASKLTHGLITKFPIDVDEDTFFVLANVLYTKFNWRTPFDVTEVEPENSFWNQQSLLTDRDGVRFYNSVDGIIISHWKHAEDSQSVVSVVSENNLDDLTLLSYAQQVINNELTPIRISDLPEKLDWVTVTTFQSSGGDQTVAVLPAWEAENKHDLDVPELAWDANAEVLAEGMDEEYEIKVSQTVVAKYGRKGFEAAAVTAFGMMRAAGMPTLRTCYKAEVNYGKPYAVICLIGGVPAFDGIIRKAVTPVED